ncbi:MAG: hypothetical protein JSW11_16595 [Candidatus Heimdallarchaeota archaeon]|nr:MAG: hypothetical protein JSW11_16595 [Candidatus Heimdallarchaeota archaeon]
MEQFTKFLPQIREDINHSLDIWKNLLINEFKENIEFIYAKGSAVKQWDSPLDYVPILSDLDIHFKLVDNYVIFQNISDPVIKSLEISEKYEQIFRTKYTKSLHLPRTQIVTINHLKKIPQYVPPRLSDVQVIYGKPILPSNPGPQRIREIDYDHLIKSKETLENTPMSLIDRSGLDYWVLIRRINWQVSPTPFRVLTQISNIAPMEIWSWNRSKIITELRNHGLEEIVEHYIQFYLNGWEAFLAQHRNSQHLRQIIFHGCKVLHSALQILQELK